MSSVSGRSLGRSNSKILHVRLPDELFEAWQKLVAEKGEHGPDLMRRIIGKLTNRPSTTLDHSALDGVGSHAVLRQVDRAPKKALKLLLTPSEHAALASLAEDRECSIQFWIVSLVRAALTNGITVGGAELIALGNSNYELSAIGRNLNQIAKQLNSGSTANHRKLKQQLDAIGEKIDSHRKKVHVLVAACSHRWRLEKSASAMCSVGLRGQSSKVAHCAGNACQKEV
jgi:hypothetical protein